MNYDSGSQTKQTTKERIMNIKSSIIKQSSIIAGALVALTMMASPQDVQATTAAGTAITNTVTVGWESTGGQGYTDTSTVTVTVNLVKTAPVLAFVSESPDAQLPAGAVDELTAVTMTYGVRATNNGPVQYTVNAPGYINTTIGAAVHVLPADFYLGASTVAYPAAAAQKSFYVPYDGTDNDFIGGANGFTEGDFLWIGGAKYTIGTITENTAADTTLPTDFKGKFAKITLLEDLAAALLPGDQVGQYREFSFDVTTGVITSPSSTGKHAVAVTVQDDAAHASNSVSAEINVGRCVLTISKTVSTDNGTTYVATSTSSDPGKKLLYRIEVTNTSNKSCKNVSVTDVLSPYVAYFVGDPVFTQGSTSSTLDYAAATKTYYDQANASFTPNGTVGSNGGARATYDANVSAFKIAFPVAATMAASSSFELDYEVWLH